MRPITDKGLKLLHEGCIALAQVEQNGIKIDVDYLQRAIANTKQRINKITVKMKNDPIFKTWRKHFGSRTNMGSRDQLGKVLFTVMEYPCPILTKTGKPKVDETALDNVDLPFVKLFVKIEKLKKANSTYLGNILRETTDGFMHPFFNLHLVQTMRSSSDHPNFQNVPLRDPKYAKVIRRAFIARHNHQIVEVDYSGIEISGAVCYHKDSNMMTYINDPKKDLHRDMAARCFKLPKKQVTKEIRYCGKNMFVFPQSYGDYYIHCAENLWEAISRMDLCTKDGTDLYSHLESEGILELGDCDSNQDPRKRTFEKHLQKVEDDFWNKHFPDYGQWRKDWYYAYLKKGYFDTLTGFRIEGLYARNQIINYPVQCIAFHWLMWSLIRIQKILKKYKMKSLIVGQIHDSIVGDVYKKELQNYLEIVQQVMTLDIRKHWEWINVPLSIEAEVAPVGGSWFEKKKVDIA